MTPFTVAGLTTIINQLLPEPHAGLLSGLLFGTKSSLPPSFYDALVRSGTLHIVALSGMNISIMSRMMQRSMAWIVGKRISSLLTLLLIAGFVWFVGPSPSIVRAAIMGGLAIFAVLSGRQYWAILSWVLAVAGMLLLNPSWISDISFQLSTLATLGIILFGDAKEKYAQNITGSLRQDLHLTLSAQVFTIPLIWWHFHRISLISPVANLAIGWIIGPLTGLGWWTMLLGWAWLPLGQVLAWCDWVALEYLVRTVNFMSALPFASWGQ